MSSDPKVQSHKAMKYEIDILLGRYRTCCVSIWNDYFNSVIDHERLSRQCWHFDLIKRRLFHALVLEPCGYYLDCDSLMEDLPRLVSVERYSYMQNEIFINRTIEYSGYWDYDIKSLSFNGVKLMFIDFFDFDEISARRFMYLLTEIALFPDAPELCGRRALIRYDGARFSLSASLGETPAV